MIESIGGTTTALVIVATGVAVIYYVQHRKRIEKKRPSRQHARVSYDITVDNTDGALEAELKAKWTRPLEQQPVHVDLPRLAKKTEIRVNGNEFWSLDEDEPLDTATFVHRTPPSQFIPSILIALAQACEETDIAEKMKQEAPKYFDTDNRNMDMSKRLLDFLVLVAGENGKVVKVLKACNQSIIAPAVFRLKSTAGNSFPYKDVRSGWRIFISINKQDIRVTHKKWERSIEDDSFQFKWEFEMIFDTQLSDLQSITLKITEVKFGPKDTKEMQTAFRAHMKNYAAWDS